MLPHSPGRVSYSQLEGLWIAQGGPSRLAPVMAAIAMAESGGNPSARNPSGATGLWQILGPPPGMTNQQMLDPNQNARAAVWKWRHQGLGAWVTYTNGAYKKFLQKGVPPSQGLGAWIGAYRNPLRGIKNLHAERIDMGVDYSGSGPLYALGPGTITAAGHAWRGAVGAPVPGTWITERLSTGPLKGRQIYYAEDITSIAVRPGQRVTGGTVIGTLGGGGQLETGFAAPGSAGLSGETAAAAAGQAASGSDPGAHPTAYGVAYSDILHATGAPAGIGPTKGGTGILPAWLSAILGGINVGTQGPQGPNLGGIAGAIAGIGNTLSGAAALIEGLTDAIDWLINPTNWVRIISGLAGGGLVLVGVYQLSHTGQRTAALPVGIALVGAGGILLFIAFHSLPPDVITLSGLISHVQQGTLAATSGQPAVTP